VLIPAELTHYDHSFIACSRHINVVLFFAHILFVVNHTFNRTPKERLQQYSSFFLYFLLPIRK